MMEFTYNESHLKIPICSSEATSRKKDNYTMANRKTQTMVNKAQRRQMKLSKTNSTHSRGLTMVLREIEHFLAD